MYTRKTEGEGASWAGDLLRALEASLENDPLWSSRLRASLAGISSQRIHLAVFVEPYLSFILDGTKTVESRFSITRRAPYGKVSCGDIVLLKKTGGPVCGICSVSNVWSYSLDPKSWSQIKGKFSRPLCVQGPEFWDQRKAAKFATLMMISDVQVMTPININKQDRRGWVVVHEGLGGQSDNYVLRWDC